MINSYCRICGLYLSAPDNYAAGRGSCPRCKQVLRIPVPLPAGSLGFVEGLRYIAEPASMIAPSGAAPAVVTAQLGKSLKYCCVKCRSVYESLQAPSRPQGQCPSCGTLNDDSAGEVVEFPRGGETEPGAAGQGQATSPGQVLWDMQGEFIVAKPARNQSPSDSIIEPIPLDPAEPVPVSPTTKTPATNAPAKPGQPRPVPTGQAQTSSAGWFYLIHGRAIGPITTEAMKTLLRTGKVSQAVFAWRGGMEIWMPIEEIPQLRVDLTPQTKASLSRVSSSPGARAGRVAQNASNMVWMSISSMCLVVLLLVMRESLTDFGPTVPRVAAMALGFAMLLCLGGGFVRLGQNWRLFRQGSATLRAKWFAGATGLIICIMLTGLLGFHSRQADVGPGGNDSIDLARRIVDTLLFEDISESYYMVDWDKLIVNGENFGQKHAGAASMDDKQLLIEGVYETFIDAFDPPFDQAHIQASTMKNWRVVQQDMEHTVVSATRPRSGAQMLFTLQGDRLIALRIIKSGNRQIGK